ncbi:hypothetical protein [Rufibacter ruber]|uniref:hypothetical protein n=1 Tax=Rufibacter ruber TaxID=1783499 RepID=UPI001F4E2BA9|nr:hypothetical protein [Rufibacter ruber]
MLNLRLPLVALLLLVLSLGGHAQPPSVNNIIPKPVWVNALGKKPVPVTAQTVIVADAPFQEQVTYLQGLLQKQLGLTLKVVQGAKAAGNAAQIYLKNDPSAAQTRNVRASGAGEPNYREGQRCAGGGAWSPDAAAVAALAESKNR